MNYLNDLSFSIHFEYQYSEFLVVTSKVCTVCTYFILLCELSLSDGVVFVALLSCQCSAEWVFGSKVIIGQRKFIDVIF
jgi:hypothetical protein